ncbi:MAG TPA: hypothetical protein VGF24_05810 [Vicinamibacterales bacterium]|jgi:cytochrome c peroxidase
MHDGSMQTLREVVKVYNDGGIRNPWLTVRVKPLKLNDADVDAIVALLESLSGEDIRTRRRRRFYSIARA